MIPAVAQTLAQILVAGTSIGSTEQIDFGYPGLKQDSTPCLNLFFYGVQESQHLASTRTVRSQITDVTNSTLPSVSWYNVLFLLVAWDETSLGEQRLLSEALMLLRCYPAVPEAILAPVLQGYGALPLEVSTIQLSKIFKLWHALQLPLRPSLHVSVTAPLSLDSVMLPTYADILSCSSGV
ncbi:MAG: Pvc16 family protein [Thainema sp.]